MKELMNYQIIQRDDDGYGDFAIGGPVPEDHTEADLIYMIVYQEDDNLVVIPWTLAERENGQWHLQFRLPEGGLYRIEILSNKCGRIRNYRHIGVGDIYVTAGQSNMTGYGNDNAYDPPMIGVHALTDNGQWGLASHPLTDSIDTIFDFPQNSTGTSPALSFARLLKTRLGIPIGIIPTAVGGSPLSSWHPEQKGDCYKAMCARLDRIGKFKGYLWYQGCADCFTLEDASSYYDRFARMLELWTEAHGPHPILTVQLNGWAGPHENDAERLWGIVRDAQRRAAMEMDNVYVVPALDMPLNDGIHNTSGANVTIGERLANAALHYIYNRPGQTVIAVSRVEAIDDTHVRLHFTAGYDVIAMYDCAAYGMNVEDENGLIDCDTATRSGHTMIVHTLRPYTMPAKFHYAWTCKTPKYVARDYRTLPLLACYGVEIEEPTEV